MQYVGEILLRAAKEGTPRRRDYNCNATKARKPDEQFSEYVSGQFVVNFSHQMEK
jgi:hypothetical protein